MVPVVRALHLAHPNLPISVDTSKAAVAHAALLAGASAVNDISGLSDPEMAQVVCAAGCDLMLMHMQGSPRTMQHRPHYEDVVSDVRAFLLERVAQAQAAGIPRDRLLIDPGIGFGKTVQHNLALLRALPEFVATGLPVLLGASRKSFIGHVSALSNSADRLEGSLAVASLAAWMGVAMLRVHDVGATCRAVEVIRAIRGGAA